MFIDKNRTMTISSVRRSGEGDEILATQAHSAPPNGAGTRPG